jgi:hypothetical protein
MLLFKYYCVLSPGGERACYDGRRGFLSSPSDPALIKRFYPDEFLIAHILDKYVAAHPQLQEHRKIIILTEAWSEQGGRDGKSNTLAINGQIVQAITEANSEEENTLVLVPFLYGYHHPGIAIDVKNKRAIYLDPKGKPAERYENTRALQLLLNKELGFEFLAIAIPQQREDDGISCGPLLTASMMKFIDEFLTSGTITPEGFQANKKNLATDRLFQMYINNTVESAGRRPALQEIMLADQSIWRAFFKEQGISEALTELTISKIRLQKNYIHTSLHDIDLGKVHLIRDFQSRIIEYVLLCPEQEAQIESLVRVGSILVGSDEILEGISTPPLLMQAGYFSSVQAKLRLNEAEEEKQESSEDKITLTVYFCGTDSSLEKTARENLYGNLASVLYQKTRTEKTHLKRGFSGCGITNGLAGGIFGAGLEKQCLEIREEVVNLLKQGKRVKLNCYGHSRGAIAALMLAKMLGHFDEDFLEINLALLDPVPGNLIISAKLDIFSQTLANQVMDLSQSKNLKRVLSLYTNKPLWAVLFHAPLLPTYPYHSEVKEDVIPGWHNEVQLLRFRGREIFFDSPQFFITFTYITYFLSLDCGTQFQSWRLWIPTSLAPQTPLRTLDMKEKVAVIDAFEEMYSMEKGQLQKATRHCHSARAATIKTEPTKTYVNLFHKEVVLAGSELKEENHDNLALSIESTCPHNRMAFSKGDMSCDNLPDNSGILFKNFVEAIHVALSQDSRNSMKGQILHSYLNEEKFANKEQLKHAIRNMLALVLQRDRNRLSFFSTTQSGYAALALLQTPDYAYFAKLILGRAAHQVRYRDLRMFVLGDNDKTYFYEKHRERIYTLFKSGAAEKPAITTDFTTRYLGFRAI